MEYLVSIVKQLFYISILSVMLVNLVPQEKYQKMIKTVCGLLLVIIMIRPILQFTDTEKVFLNIYHSITQSMDLAEMKNGGKILQTTQDDVVVQEYEEQIEENIDSMILSQGLYPAETTVHICEDENSSKYGCIESILLIVSTQEQNKPNHNTAVIESVHVKPVTIQHSETNQTSQQGDEQLDSLAQDIATYYKVDKDAVSIRYQ